MRTLLVALLVTLLIPAAAWATCTGTTPSLCVSLNKTAFQKGQTLNLAATVIPAMTSANVDVYVALKLPTGGFLFLQGNGIFTTSQIPFASDWSPTSYSGNVFSYTFGGGEPGGTYTWYAAFADPGTLNFVGGIASAAFTFTPPPANLNGTYALSGTISQTGCGPGFDGTFQTSGQIDFHQSGTSLTGTGTMVTPNRLETSALILTGTVSGNSISGSFTSNTNYNGTIGPGMGLFSGTLSGNTLVITISSNVTGCSFTLSLAGNRP